MIWYAIRSPQKLKLLIPNRPLILVCGLALAVNYFGYMRGLEMTSASNAQIMIQLGPIGLLLAGIFYFGEKPSMTQTFGLLFASIGFALFFWDQILMSLADASRYIHGNLWIALAAGTWTIFAVLQKGLKGKWSPQQFNMVIYVICTIALWPFAHTEQMLS